VGIKAQTSFAGVRRREPRGIADIWKSDKQQSTPEWGKTGTDPALQDKRLRTSDARVCVMTTNFENRINTSSLFNEFFMLLATKKSAAATREQAFSSLFFRFHVPLLPSRTILLPANFQECRAAPTLD